MRVLVVGLGSMGKRRIRLMRSFFNHLEIVGVDSRSERRQQTSEMFSVKCFGDLGEAVESFRPQIGFICAPPLAHAKIINELLCFGCHIFSEINLTDDMYEENQKLAEQKGLVLFLSSTQMYRKEIEYITDAAKHSRERLAYRYHIGQYLPDWHPWESYKDFFVSDPRTNGCREIFAIELPWIADAFGDVENLQITSSRISSLEISYPDCYALNLSHSSGVSGQLMVDLVCRRAVRDFELFGENLYLSWRGSHDSLCHFDIAEKQNQAVPCYDDVLRDSRYSDNIVENAYVEEIEDFLGVLSDGRTPKHSFAANKKVIALIDKIERSAVCEEG